AGATGLLIVLAGLCGVVAVVLAMHLHRGYVLALEQRLLDHASAVDLDPMDDVLRTGAVMQTMATIDVGRFIGSRSESSMGAELAVLRSQARAESKQKESAPPTIHDPQVARLVELRSGEFARVTAALTDPRPFERYHAPQLVDLLAWDEVSGLAIRALTEIAPTTAGVLLDALLDPGQEFTIRRRVPRILARVESRWVVAGLIAGLGDKRFEVRYQCGRALARIHHRQPEIAFDEQEICDAVLREVAVDRRVWESHRLLDRLEDSEADGTEWLNEYLADRTGRGLEHVFTLLALILPGEPLRIAFRGLHTSDARLRGTALVYLESVLPESVREHLWPFIDREQPDTSTTPRDREALLEELMRSNAAIEASIAGLAPSKPSKA
ncbi:MAG: hypothetical protein AAF658_04215, partial [Myxococcota bacterium]